MWKKAVSYAVITLAVFLGLNLYISSSLSTLIKEESQKAVQKLDSDIILRMGPVESSPFRGNIDLSDIYYNHAGTQSSAELESFSLDLSYIDFLRLYFFGIRSGMSEITSLDFLAGNLKLRNLSRLPNMTVGSISCSYSGSLWQLLQLGANQQLPGSSADLTLDTKNIHVQPFRSDTTYQPLSISRGFLKTSYQGNFKTATINKFKLTGAELTAQSEGRISFNTRSRTMKDISDVQLDLSLDYQNQNSTPFSFKTGFGRISFESLSWTSNISTVDNENFELRSWQSWGDQSTIEAQNISFELTGSGNRQSITSMILQTLFDSSAAIPLQQFRLESESDGETLTVQNLRINHNAFEINADGNVVKKASPWQSEFRNFTVTLTEMEPEFRNMVQNMSQMLGIRFSSGSESLSINVTGRLGKPGISK